MTEAHGVVHKADKETLDAAALVEARLRRLEDYDALFDMQADEPEFDAAMWRLVQYAQGLV